MDSSYRPKLRAVEAHWIRQGNQPALLLQDRVLSSARVVLVPEMLVPLLSLCDGTHDLPTLRSAYELQTGIRLEQSVIDRAIEHLDEALMLDGERHALARRQAMDEYRSSPFRPAALAGASYPADRTELAALLDGYIAGARERRDGRPLSDRPLRGLICPHIDYDRGGVVYGEVWDRAARAIAEADRFIILGTDHQGGPGEITLTGLGYQTPFGVLPTDREAVDRIAVAMGVEAAFHSELNHRIEHSVELAAVWLHHMVGSRPVQIVPVLCGSFYPFTQGEMHPSQHSSWAAGAAALGEIARMERTMVIVAADLAHMGPSFGDPDPMDGAAEVDLTAVDAEMMAIVCRGDAEGFLSMLTWEQDRRKVCGLPPIYLALKMLDGGVAGEVVGYSVCPAPDDSVVSVTGILLQSPA
jgi:MEMO1 family protein